MELPANLSVIIQVVLFVVGAYVFALYLGLLVWTWRDVRARSRDFLTALLSLLAVLLLNLLGLVLYLILRPRHTLAELYARELEEEALLQEIEDRHSCPDCERRVEPDFVLCPWCRTTLRNRCAACGELLNLHWEICPYCGEDLPPLVTVTEALEAAAEEELEEPEIPEMAEVLEVSDVPEMAEVLEASEMPEDGGTDVAVEDDQAVAGGMPEAG